MKVYQIIADTYMGSYGSSMVSFGIFSTKEKAIESMKNYNSKVFEFIAKYNDIPTVDYSIYEENPTKENMDIIDKKEIERENSIKKLLKTIGVPIEYDTDIYDTLSTDNTFIFKETRFDSYIKEIELDSFDKLLLGCYLE